MKRIIILAGAAAALAACGEVKQRAEMFGNAADAAIDGQGIGNAIGSAIDTDGLKGVVEGAATQAIREVVPAAEIGAVGAVVKEKELVSGIERAVDGQALKEAVKEAVKHPGQSQVRDTAE